jgi:hypothetical protein
MKQLNLDPTKPAQSKYDGLFKWAIVEKATSGAVLRFDGTPFTVWSMTAYPLPFKEVQIESGTVTILCGQGSEPFPGGSGGTLQGAAGGSAVEGSLATGVAATDNPILVAGVDSGNIRRSLIVDGGGHLVTRAEFAELIRAGQAFSMASALAASVGNVSVHQIFNPNLSGKKFFLLGALVSITVSGEVKWAYDTAATGFSDGNTIATRLTDGGTGFSVVAGFNTKQTPGVPGTMGFQIGRTFLVANTPLFIQVPDAWLAEIPQNLGFNIATVSQNVGLTTTFVWAETANAYAP